MPLKLSKWSLPASLVPAWCWCLPGCPNSPFLPPWCLPGASQAVQLVFSCLPGASLVLPQLPPGMSTWLSRASRAVRSLEPPRQSKRLFCCLMGCPRRYLEPPKHSRWLSGASRAAQIALVVHPGPPGSPSSLEFAGLSKWLSRASRAAQMAKHLTKGHRGPASASLKVTGNEKGRARFCPKCVHFTINFAKRGPNPRPHEIFQPGKHLTKGHRGQRGLHQILRRMCPFHDELC